jgi:hypothetical protein
MRTSESKATAESKRAIQRATVCLANSWMIVSLRVLHLPPTPQSRVCEEDKLFQGTRHAVLREHNCQSPD